MPKLLDSFLFNGEVAMLKARIEYLCGVVDRFVVIECETDHSLRPREVTPNSVFDALMKEFQVPIDHYLISEFGLPQGPNNWPRVWAHRNYISGALERDFISPSDWLLISDIDEFPNVDILEMLKTGNARPVVWEQTQNLRDALIANAGGQPTVIQFLTECYYYDLWHKSPNPWIGSRLCTVADALHVSPEVIRRWPNPIAQIGDGGWHLSYFGGVDAIKQKMESIAESSWTGNPEYTDKEKIAARIKAGKDLYERDGETWTYTLPLGIPAVLLKHFPSPLFAPEKAQPVVYVETQYPIAEDSLDHQHPCGAARDNSRHAGFVKKVLGIWNHKPYILDIGCAGGGMVSDFIGAGCLAVGIEGSDYPLKHDKGEWPRLGGVNLFTADATERFQIKYPDSTADISFDVITSWEVMEHIAEDDLGQFMNNVKRHLTIDGYFICSINSDPWEWDGVDLHVTCVVEDTPLLAEGVRAATRRPYAGTVCSVVTRNGNKLTVTPNHPVLTQRGWIAAKFLCEGDYVISRLRGQGEVTGVVPDDNHIPTPVKEVFQSLVEMFQPLHVPCTPEDFHSDGTDGYIQVVRPDGGLLPGFDAPFVQPTAQQSFNGGDSKPFLFNGQRPLAGTGELVNVFSGKPGRPLLSEEFSFLLAHEREFQPLRFGGTPDENSVLGQDALNGNLAYSESRGQCSKSVATGVISTEGESVNPGTQENKGLALGTDVNVTGDEKLFSVPNVNAGDIGEFVETFAGQIAFDEIVCVQSSEYVGHVYNLETDTSWYFANNIISHNCKPMDWWIEKLKTLGWTRSETMEKYLGDDWVRKGHGNHVFVRANPAKDVLTKEQPAESPVEASGSLLERRLVRLQTINGYRDMAPYGDLLTGLASKADSILELGTFNGVSTTYLIAGLAKSSSKRTPYIACCDVQRTPDVDELSQVASSVGVAFHYEQVSSLELNMESLVYREKFDLVLIDSQHTGSHVKAELAVVAPYARRLVFHDTELFGYEGNDGTAGIWAAIGEFLCKNSQWEVETHRSDGVGLTVLKLKEEG